MQRYYLIGGLSLFLFWLISWAVTRNLNPFAIAQSKSADGENNNYSASLVQMLIFTLLTVFAYTTVFAARVSEDGSILNSWINVPGNLLILMGVSVGTAVASRAIKVEQAKSGTLPAADNSSLTTNRDGKTDLIKIQMLIWTLIAVVVYLIILNRFLFDHCYSDAAAAASCPKPLLTLPDIDTAFMVLLGVSQGGYVVNQLSEKPAQ